MGSTITKEKSSTLSCKGVSKSFKEIGDKTLTSRLVSTKLPSKLCADLLAHLRKEAVRFRHINKEEEPPLRSLDHGLHGEGVCQLLAPYPYMIQSSDGIWYHGYRFDQSVCEEAAHTSEGLRRLFGPKDSDTGTYFRQVLGYAAGSKPGLASTAPELLDELSSALRPACLQVYPGHKVARLFSVYANLLLPGQTVTLHLDVPEFIGVERSTCPSWLLVAAHCSGLFARFRVNNVTAVCYPSSCKEGGSLAVYHQEGGVFPVEQRLALALDTDSHFHHSRVSGPLGTLPPSLPDHCVLEVDEQSPESPPWRVVSSEKEVVVEHKEEEIIEGLLEELEKRGLSGMSKETPLYKLAPVLV